MSDQINWRVQAGSQKMSDQINWRVQAGLFIALNVLRDLSDTVDAYRASQQGNIYATYHLVGLGLFICLQMYLVYLALIKRS